jgi:RNA polymerase sigma-70 factor (ECF subfamily)
VVRNVFLDHHRRGKRWTSLEDLAAAEEAPREMILDAAQEDAASRSHAAAAVRRAVAALAPRWRLPVVLRYGAGLAYDEIAEVLGVSPGTVASRLSRAHARLAKKLGHLRS